jgi:hypothetical protein
VGEPKGGNVPHRVEEEEAGTSGKDVTQDLVKKLKRWIAPT